MVDGPFNHGDIQNIKNYSGQNDSYFKNIPNILLELGMAAEEEWFANAVKSGSYTIVEEIMRLVTDYPAVREKFGKNSLDIMTALYLKSKTGSLNIRIDDSEDELQGMISDEKVKTPEDILLMKEDSARLQELSEQLREPCMGLFEKEFCGEEEYLCHIKEKDFKKLCAELSVYNDANKGSHKTGSELFKDYREISGMTDDRLIGPIHTRFAKKIKHIFDNMKKDPAVRRIHNESRS
jgi:hypothetical protein